MLEVISPGLMSSVQDLGRRGFAHLGVSQSGALDPISLHLANRLVENPSGAAALEIIMSPATFVFHRPCWIALTGAACRAYLDDEPVWFGWRVPVRKGQTLKLGPAKKGLCSYLAVSGGFDVSLVMGSASADFKAGFGGFCSEGSPLKKGDKLEFRAPFQTIHHILGIQLPQWDNQLRVMEGPEFEQFTEKAQHDFFHSDWLIDNSSNRMGFRLRGLELKRNTEKEMLSQGVFNGVIQVPPNGLPIILAAEAQSTGGYPRIAVIIQADRWKLGQVSISQYLCFKKCTSAEAKKALLEQQAYLHKVEYVLNNSR